MWHSCLLLFALSSGLVPVAFGDRTICFQHGNCYTVNTTLLTFNNAKMACGSKGSLASMKNRQEREEIFNLVTRFQDQRNISSFWLGLHLPQAACITTDKDLYGFVWISGGDTTEVTEWKNTPTRLCPQKTKRRCVILETGKMTPKASSSVTLVWRDARCDRIFPSICRTNESRESLSTKDIEVVTLSSTDQSKTRTSASYYSTTHASITAQHTEVYSSILQVSVPCIPSFGKETACAVIVSYACNATHCSCRNMNDSRVRYEHRSCKNSMNTSCQELCIKSIDIQCSCDDHHIECEGEECMDDLLSSSESPLISSTDLRSASSTSAPLSDDDNLLDRLIIPLILGLVAFGILVMLVWGGVQMCIRKRKPKRRKSIAPAPPEGSDTDSTDHSSSEEEEEDEEGDGESQDRTEEP